MVTNARTVKKINQAIKATVSSRMARSQDNVNNNGKKAKATNSLATAKVRLNRMRMVSQVTRIQIVKAVIPVQKTTPNV